VVSIKTVTNADTGTSDIVGGDDWDSAVTIINNNYPSAADFTVYIEGGTIKARNNALQTVPYSHATDLGNVLSSIHGVLSSTTGGTIRIKSGSYGWNTQLAITKSHVAIICDTGVIVTVNSGFATDCITIDKDDCVIQGFSLFDCTNQGNGNGSWVVIGNATVNSDRPRIIGNYVKSPGTNGVQVVGNCNGLWLLDNQIQSFLGPTGDGVLLAQSADHIVRGNHIGGFGNATNGAAMRISDCTNFQISMNELFTSRICLRMYLPRGATIIGNLIQAATQHNVLISNDTSTVCGRTSIIGNRIHDGSTSATNTYDGINIGISSTGGFDDLVIMGNVITDQSLASKKQKYGINLASNPDLITNSVIAFNALAGNQTGAINRGAYDSTTRIFGNTGDTVPYNFEDFVEERVLASAPSDPSAGFNRRYSRTIDSNNDAYCVKRKINGAVVEVLL